MFSYDPKTTSSYTFPWAFKHDIFNAEQLKEIIKYCGTLPKAKGAIGDNKVDEKIRSSQLAWVSPYPESQWFFDVISAEIEALNNVFYRYDLWGYPNLQYTEYSGKSKGKYDFHMDMGLGEGHDQSVHRKLSAVLLLNDRFKGGKFQMTSNGTNIIEAEMRPGTLIVFPSFMLHRVTPVTSGCRKTLVAWVLGPKFR